jgi:CheY-like chemotaxis protein
MTRVLVVDDSPIDRKLAGNQLEKNTDWTVEYANDGQQGLEAIRRQQPDLVLTDLQMPELDGLELCCAVRREFPDVSVILMTARGSEEVALAALQAGAASYVPKRALAHQLLETARRVLSARNDDRVQREVLRRMQSRSESFVVENDLELLLSLSRYLQLSLATQWGLDMSARMQVGMALEEALLNSYYHGNLEVDSKLKEEDFQTFYQMAETRRATAPYRDRTITVESRLTSQGVSYSIRDQGPGFDLSKLPDPTALENLDRPCGRGVMLMRAFMDEVHFNEKGNQVTLVKISPSGGNGAGL